MVKEAGKLICRVTGREVIGWDVTDPDAPERTQKVQPEPLRSDQLEQILRDAIGELRAEGTLFSYAMARRLEGKLKGIDA